MSKMKDMHVGILLPSPSVSRPLVSVRFGRQKKKKKKKNRIDFTSTILTSG